MTVKHDKCYVWGSVEYGGVEGGSVIKVNITILFNYICNTRIITPGIL